jgi:ubiquinone/menaquinone biosynthesis C-methylase UbiE
MRKHLGELSDIQVVHSLLEIQGLALLDLGCGPAKATELLAESALSVHGIEPDPVQAQANQDKSPVPGLTLSQGYAQSLPQADDSVDGVFFFRSLHHVPMDAMDQALAEAQRVVRPGGFVFVLEPSTRGAHTALMLPFHDETQVRGAAQQALARAERELFQSRAQFECLQHSRYESFAQLVERFSSMSFNSIKAASVDQPAVREAFQAGRSGQEFIFDQPTLIDLFRVA